MQDYVRRPNRHASGREVSADPEPGGVRLVYDAQNRDIVVDIPSGSPVNRDYILDVLQAMIDGLEGGHGGGPYSGCFQYEYDVFISHAGSDKEEIVNELVRCLRDLEVKVWFDTSNITWGDSLRGSMDEGLKKARYGVVILSPNYIAQDRYWTKAEMDALFLLESATRKKVLIPVWHHLTKEEVIAFSPLIASRSAMNTSTMTIAEIAIQIAKLVRTDK